MISEVKMYCYRQRGFQGLAKVQWEMDSIGQVVVKSVLWQGQPLPGLIESCVNVVEQGSHTIYPRVYFMTQRLSRGTYISPPKELFNFF